jgi:branched-chain amino acid transport system ATP-binding protein
LLEIREADQYYDDLQVLHGISLTVNQGEIVALVGPNAAGKSTTLNMISGVIKPRRGRITFQGRRVDTLPAHAIVELGIVQIPEGRGLFPFMTALENLELGSYGTEARRRKVETLEHVLELLPVLKERQNQMAGSLSGGEQQMLAIGRGLMARPKLLMLDEPSLGLAPMLVQKCFEIVKEVHAQGTTVLLVEQNVHHALTLSDRGYVLENGRIVMGGKGTDLLGDPNLRRAYLGG